MPKLNLNNTPARLVTAPAREPLDRRRQVRILALLSSENDREAATAMLRAAGATRAS